MIRWKAAICSSLRCKKTMPGAALPLWDRDGRRYIADRKGAAVRFWWHVTRLKKLTVHGLLRT